MILDAIKLALPEIWNIYRHRKDKRDKTFAAIEAIQRAANRTRYIIASNDYLPHTPNVELSNLWIDAASAVRELDKDLYGRLLDKSEYWADPAQWNEQMVRDTRIYINDIIEDSNRFLKELSEKDK